MQGNRTISSLGVESLGVRIAALAIGFTGAVLLARGLGPSDRGLYAVAITVAALAYAVGNVGLELAQFRAWARKTATPEVLITTGIVFSLALGAVTLLLGPLSYLIWRDSVLAGVRFAELMTALAAVPIQLHLVLVTGLLLVTGNLRWTNLALVVGTGVQAIVVLALFAAGALTVQTGLIAYLALCVAQWGVMLIRLRKIGRPAKRVPLRFLSEQLRTGVAVYPYVVLHFLNLRIDILLLASLGSDTDVGLYAVAVTFAELMWFFSDAVMAPVVERQANAPKPEAIRITVLAVRMSILVVAVGAIALSIIATVALGLLYGEDFVPAREAVWALAPAAVAMAIWRPLVATLLRTEHAALQSITAIVALTVNVIANVILIPPLGMVGAGLASVASYASGAAVAVMMSRKHLGIQVADIVPGPSDVRRLTRVLAPRNLRRELAYLVGR